MAAMRRARRRVVRRESRLLRRTALVGLRVFGSSGGLKQRLPTNRISEFVPERTTAEPTEATPTSRPRIRFSSIG